MKQNKLGFWVALGAAGAILGGLAAGLAWRRRRKKKGISSDCPENGSKNVQDEKEEKPDE